MSSPIDLAAQNAALDALLGDGAAASIPSSWEVALFDGDPAAGGAELDSAGGYVRAVIANDSATWPDAVDGEKLSSIISLATPTDEWTVGGQLATATHYLLIDAADSTTQWLPGQLADPLTVYGTETAIQIQLSQFWNTEGVF